MFFTEPDLRISFIRSFRNTFSLPGREHVYPKSRQRKTVESNKTALESIGISAAKILKRSNI